MTEDELREYVGKLEDEIEELLAEVQRLREENLRLTLRVDRLLSYRESMEGLPPGTIPR